MNSVHLWKNIFIKVLILEWISRGSFHFIRRINVDFINFISGVVYLITHLAEDGK